MDILALPLALVYSHAFRATASSWALVFLDVPFMSWSVPSSQTDQHLSWPSVCTQTLPHGGRHVAVMIRSTLRSQPSSSWPSDKPFQKWWKRSFTQHSFHILLKFQCPCKKKIKFYFVNYRINLSYLLLSSNFANILLRDTIAVIYIWEKLPNGVSFLKTIYIQIWGFNQACNIPVTTVTLIILLPHTEQIFSHWQSNEKFY